MKEAVVSGATTPPSSVTMEGEGQPKEQEAPQQQQQPAAVEAGAAGGEEGGPPVLPVVPQEGEEQHAPEKPVNGTGEGGSSLAVWVSQVCSSTALVLSKVHCICGRGMLLAAKPRSHFSEFQLLN